jgi:hypothetical protein
MTDECSMCRYWKPRADLGEIGECRRHAPTAANQATLFAGEAIIAVAHMLSVAHNVKWPDGTDAEVTETRNWAMFPRTYADAWCGEFQRHA